MAKSTWQNIQHGLWPATCKSYSRKTATQRSRREVVAVWEHLPEFCERKEAELANGTYHVGPYRHKELHDKKKTRWASILPFEDRCVQNDMKEATEPIIMKLMTDDMMGGLPGRGILAGGTRKIKKENLRYCVVRRMRIAMNNLEWKYYLQGDISKFYDNIDNVIAMRLLERKITHRRTLALIRQHLFNQKELAIGDPMSHLIANMVMSQIIRKAKAKYGKRICIINFADDFIAFARNKSTLNELRRDLKRWAKEYRLHYKPMQVKPVDRAAAEKPEVFITFCGYRYARGVVRITKRMKRNVVARRHSKRSMGSYKGMLDIADTKHLQKLIIHQNNTHMSNEKKIHRPFAGQPVKIDVLMGRNHTIVDFKKVASKTKGNGSFYYHIQAISKTLKLFVYSTGSEKIVDFLNTKSAADLPLKDMVIQKDWSGYFYEGTVYTDEEEEAFIRQKYGLLEDKE